MSLLISPEDEARVPAESSRFSEEGGGASERHLTRHAGVICINVLSLNDPIQIADITSLCSDLSDELGN